MKRLFVLLIAALTLSACATHSTITSRRQERLPAYNALTPEQKEAADRGQIKIGTTEDGVYIAWGSPDQILRTETAAGSQVTWVYMGQWMEETRFWGRRGLVTREYYPRSYVSAQVVFENGKVVRWETLPRPY